MRAIADFRQLTCLSRGPLTIRSYADRQNRASRKIEAKQIHSFRHCCGRMHPRVLRIQMDARTHDARICRFCDFSAESDFSSGDADRESVSRAWLYVRSFKVAPERGNYEAVGAKSNRQRLRFRHHRMPSDRVPQAKCGILRNRTFSAQRATSLLFGSVWRHNVRRRRFRRQMYRETDALSVAGKMWQYHRLRNGPCR
jgi:hypothetical protein